MIISADASAVVCCVCVGGGGRAGDGVHDQDCLRGPSFSSEKQACPPESWGSWGFPCSVSAGVFGSVSPGFHSDQQLCVL